jgi:hypothetical protein
MIPMRGSLRIAGYQAASLDVDAGRALGRAHISEDRLGMALIAEFTAEEKRDPRQPAQTTLCARLACRTGSDYRDGAAAKGRIRRATGRAQGIDRNPVGRPISRRFARSPTASW